MNVVLFRDKKIGQTIDRLRSLNLGSVEHDLFRNLVSRCKPVLLKGSIKFALPNSDRIERLKNVLSYSNETVSIESSANQWTTLYDGRYLTDVKRQIIENFLSKCKEDVIFLNFRRSCYPDEFVRLTTKNTVAGVARKYSCNFWKSHLPTDWPHCVFIRSNVLKHKLNNEVKTDLEKFLQKLENNHLRIAGFQSVCNFSDMISPKEMSGFILENIKKADRENAYIRLSAPPQKLQEHGIEISDTAKLYGDIYCGKGVIIQAGAVIIGPTMIGADSVIRQGAFIRNSIIEPGSHICKTNENKNLQTNSLDRTIFETEPKPKFKTWPRLSYPGSFKRGFDILFSSAVLLFSLPLWPIIAGAVKLTSRGPIFFRHSRQGLHGRDFDCFKFRTMITGADDIQEKLRSKNQVDGPQFMIEKDPRITEVGQFLRKTYLDEIPQFINILKGDMSVVGPRPSPVAENSQCAFWRDARLSVRPGITGLWQIKRTRRQGKDFQEWIHFDTEYVRDISFRKDLAICLLTAKKMVSSFFDKSE